MVKEAKQSVRQGVRDEIPMAPHGQKEGGSVDRPSRMETDTCINLDRGGPCVMRRSDEDTKKD